MIIYRQGDVMLIKVASVPKNAAEEDLSKADRVVLAYGEVTGHAHAIPRTSENKMPVRAWNSGAERFIQVMEKTALKHEEHSPITLDLGVYKVVHQQEYSPDEIRRVVD
jgi:hypothetical protein